MKALSRTVFRESKAIIYIWGSAGFLVYGLVLKKVAGNHRVNTAFNTNRGLCFPSVPFWTRGKLGARICKAQTRNHGNLIISIQALVDDHRSCLLVLYLMNLWTLDEGVSPFTLRIPYHCHGIPSCLKSRLLAPYTVSHCVCSSVVVRIPSSGIHHSRPSL